MGQGADLKLVEFICKSDLVTIVLHDGLVDIGLYLLHSLHIVLYIVADGHQFLDFMLQSLTGQTQICLCGCPVVQDRVVAEVLLHFEHILHLPEVGSHLLQHSSIVRLGSPQGLLTLGLPPLHLPHLPRQIPQELLDLTLPG